MKDLFDITKFDSYKEDNRREVKKANGGLPASLWDTYSAFANCYGGVIILGVAEDKDGDWRTTGLRVSDKRKLLKQFWDTVNNRKKVNINILKDDDVKTYELNDDLIIVIYVPMAKRDQKPVYINDDLFGSTFRRNHEGDYRCTRLQVKTMLRDQTENTMDMKILDDVPMEDLNYETIRGYRNRHRTLKSGHPFERLNDAEYLRSIGAAAVSREDKALHPTAAGMLMFGDEYNIVRHFPEYFLDYREMLDPSIRWTDRIQSSSGDWSGNLCDFYFRVYNKLSLDIKTPFAMVGGESDPRNKSLMKMFNLINIGERSGSGVPNIFNTWEDEHWKEPTIAERFDPDRTILTLEFLEKQASKTSDKKQAIKVSDKRQAAKTSDHKEKIHRFLIQSGESTAKDIANFIELSVQRTRAILATMDEVEVIGANKNRKYRIRK